MMPLTEEAIRSSFVNASRRDRAGATLPDLDALAWDDLDYLGWRDAKIPGRAYAVVPVTERGEERLIGMMFRQAQAPPKMKVMCAWCEDVWLSSEVVFYGAKRSGAGGRQGNTVGTYLCRDFECSENVRRDPPLPYKGYDQDAARTVRIDNLQLRVATFARSL